MKKICIISTLFTTLLFSFIAMAQNELPVYRKIGPVYIVKNPGNATAVLSIAEYEHSADHSWHYFLELLDVKDNNVLNIKEIAVTIDKTLEHEQVIGRLGDVILVIADSLVGYDVHTLEPVLTEATIIAANPFMQDNISRHQYSYLLDEAAEVMYIRAENDDRYKLYPGSPLLKPDDGINEPAPADFNYETAANYKLYDRCELKSAVTCIDTSDDNFYILGSEKETGYVLSYFGTAIFPDRKEDRKLTIVPYHADGEKLDFKKDPPKTSKASYFNSGFLQNKSCTTAWRSSLGERLIIFKVNTLNPALCVALIDKNGLEKWRKPTTMPADNFIDYLVTEGNLLLWFNNVNNKKFISSTVINVDLATGNIVK